MVVFGFLALSALATILGAYFYFVYVRPRQLRPPPNVDADDGDQPTFDYYDDKNDVTIESGTTIGSKRWISTIESDTYRTHWKLAMGAAIMGATVFIGCIVGLFVLLTNAAP